MRIWTLCSEQGPFRTKPQFRNTCFCRVTWVGLVKRKLVCKAPNCDCDCQTDETQTQRAHETPQLVQAGSYEFFPTTDNTDAHTTKIGACNTVVRAQDGKLYGFNTDAAGIVRPLERRLNTLEGARILVIGAGGAARAAVFGLKERGSEVYILNRTAAPAKKLAHQAWA